MTELSEKEKAHAALDKLALDTPLTEVDRVKLYDDIYWYICSLELQLRILG
jgi:hypothetical protein